MQFSIKLQAGEPLRQEFTGTNLVLLDTGANTTGIDLSLEVAGFQVENFCTVKRGLKLHTATGQFTGATFTSAVACTIQVIVSSSNIDVNYVDGASVNILGTVPVSNDRGSPGAPVYVSGLTYSDAPATGRKDNAPVTAGPTATLLLAANPNRKEVRICNLGADEVAIGGAGITWANRAIVMGKSDTFFDDKAAALAVYMITDTAKAATVTTQEVLA